MKTDILIIGAGIAGITLARRMAEEKNLKVLLVERRKHIGGYCFDYRDPNGILVHRYGPHIFRTDSEQVYNFLSRFTDWYDYQHKVLANVEGKLYPMPINLDTVNGYLGTNYTSENVAEYFEKVKTFPKEINNVKDAVESQIGPVFYKAFFENYTKKQWGEAPENLPADIIARIPIRANRDDRYFTAKYQAIPAEGYTAMMQRMLDHKNIRVLLNTDYKEIQNEIECSKIFYSGSIDEFYDYRFGRLPYRCVSFKFEELGVEEYQPVAVVNYPNNFGYTRITEFKHFGKGKTEHTVIAKEYSSDCGEPSYPIPIKDNLKLYRKYEGIKQENVIFIGRLGRYRYYSMDQIIEELLSIAL